MLVAIIITGGTIGLVIPFLLIALIFLNIFKLIIVIYNNQIQLILGTMGLFKKTIQLSELDLKDFKEKSVPWYLKGTLFKYDYQGNLIFCPKSGKALVLKYKNAKNSIFIVSQDNRKLFKLLKQAEQLHRNSKI
jgi:hypothetical protein